MPCLCCARKHFRFVMFSIARSVCAVGFVAVAGSLRLPIQKRCCCLKSDAVGGMHLTVKHLPKFPNDDISYTLSTYQYESHYKYRLKPLPSGPGNSASLLKDFDGEQHRMAHGFISRSKQATHVHWTLNQPESSETEQFVFDLDFCQITRKRVGCVSPATEFADDCSAHNQHVTLNQTSQWSRITTVLEKATTHRFHKQVAGKVSDVAVGAGALAKRVGALLLAKPQGETSNSDEMPLLNEDLQPDGNTRSEFHTGSEEEGHTPVGAVLQPTPQGVTESSDEMLLHDGDTQPNEESDSEWETESESDVDSEEDEHLPSADH